MSHTCDGVLSPPLPPLHPPFRLNLVLDFEGLLASATASAMATYPRSQVALGNRQETSAVSSENSTCIWAT